jgi:L-serine dehydratase
MTFTTGEELLTLCENKQISISKAMLEREKIIGGLTEEEIIKKLQESYHIMEQAIHTALEQDLVSIGGLIGGEGKKIYKRKEKAVCGSVVSKAISYAMGVLEVNASMGLIVAAPTAGSSGVVPGVLQAIKEEYNFSEQKMLEALLNAGAIGYIVTRNATVAGAEGGCQAEVGTASAMAASAVVELMGGSPKACLSAASTALTNLLGLVCDPVGGLVEAPCQGRNGIGASNALVAAEMALSEVYSLIPFDEIVEAMYRVGRSLPFELRETALGGIAATKTACSLCK